jgi:hypothetical protein
MGTNITSLAFRIVFDIIVGILFFYGYWYFALPIIFILAYRYSFYFEGIILALIYDSFFSFDQGFIHRYIMTIFSIIVILVSRLIKHNIR